MKTILLLLYFGLSQCAYAQEQIPAKDPSESNFVALRADIKALQTEQQLIITRLDELKQLLQGLGKPPATVASTSVRDEPFRGNSVARVAIVEYADFECPYCGEFERQVFPKILSDYIETGKVKFFYRDLPLPGHPHALPAARAARCAGEQGKYWEMHDSLFAKQNSLSDSTLLERAKTLDLNSAKFAECQAGEKYMADIQNNISDARKMGIGGTPTFFLGVIEPNGDVTIEKRFQGSAPFDTFKSNLDALLASDSQKASSTH